MFSLALVRARIYSNMTNIFRFCDLRIRDAANSRISDVAMTCQQEVFTETVSFHLGQKGKGKRKRRCLIGFSLMPNDGTESFNKP